jgi:hypothetical protein
LVIESRAATDLGPNVKLVTYVSIFYMPVGIFAAIWSINPDYGLVAFGIVTAVVAVVTYILVANFNNTVDAARVLYRAAETWVVTDMIKESKDPFWESKGREFSQLRPKRDNIMPSKWYVLWYVVLRNVRLVFMAAPQEDSSLGHQDVTERVSTQAGGEGGHSEMPSGQGVKKWFSGR